MVAAPSRAESEPSVPRFTRDDGARGCPDSVALSRRVEVVAGKALFSWDANESRDTWVQVEFVRAISGFRAVIAAHGRRQGTRALDDVGPGLHGLPKRSRSRSRSCLDPATAQQ